MGVARGLGMLGAARGRAQVVRPGPAWARAHAPRAGLGWAGGGARPPAGPQLGQEADGGGGGKVPVT